MEQFRLSCVDGETAAEALMPIEKNGSLVDPVDAQIGGDADIDGIAQTLTSDDINAVLMSSQPTELRLESLKAMRAEIEARSHADFGNDMAPLLDDIDAAIAQLASRI
jgi:hypothetical protein